MRASLLIGVIKILRKRLRSRTEPLFLKLRLLQILEQELQLDDSSLCGGKNTLENSTFSLCMQTENSVLIVCLRGEKRSYACSILLQGVSVCLLKIQRIGSTKLLIPPTCESDNLSGTSVIPLGQNYCRSAAPHSGGWSGTSVSQRRTN